MESVTLKQIAFNAMLEFVAQPGNEHAFESSGIDSYTEKELFWALTKRLTIPELAERACYSSHCGEHNLPASLAYHASKNGLKELHTLKKTLEESWQSVQYGSIHLACFAEAYWNIVIGERIKRRDFRRVWDDIKKSVREADCKNGELVRYTDRHLRGLYHAMEDARLLGGDRYDGTHHFHEDTAFYGLAFLFELYPRSRERIRVDSFEQPRKIKAGRYDFEGYETLIFELARYFARERQRKRDRSLERRLSSGS